MRGCVVLFLLLGACAAVPPGPPRDPRQGSVSLRDFFLYACAREYEVAHGFRSYDGSLAYAVEWIEADAATLSRVYEQASAAAARIRAPDFSDPEHGLPAVLVLCAQAAKELDMR